MEDDIYDHVCKNIIEDIEMEIKESLKKIIGDIIIQDNYMPSEDDVKNLIDRIIEGDLNY